MLFRIHLIGHSHVTRHALSHTITPRLLYSTISKTSTSSQIQSHANAANDRSLYRALLRESGYFPESNVREYLKKQIKQRFREYHPKVFEKEHEIAFIQARVANVRRKARQALHGLQRANNGNIVVLGRFIAHAYGRLGRRRRELIEDMLRRGNIEPVLAGHQDQATPSATEDDADIENFALETAIDEADEELMSQDVSPLSDTTANIKPTTTRASKYVRPLGQALREVTISQNMTALKTSRVIRNRRPGRIEPKIPQFNTWLRPMPKCRVKNITKRHRTTLLTRILPPLPVGEWLELYDLASSRRKITTIRRKNKPQEVDLAALVTLKSSIHDNDLMQQGQCRVTPRKLQQACADVFSTCPVLTYDADAKRSIVTWGQEALSKPSLVEAIRSKYDGKTS